MSESSKNRFNEKEDFQDVMGNGNSGETSCQQNSRWMAHGTRASSSAYGKSCSPLEDGNNSTLAKDSGTSLFEPKRSSVAERLMLGGNYGGISMENVQQLNSNMPGVAHDGWQEDEQEGTEWRDGCFQSPMVQMQRDESFYAKRVVPETLSVRRLPDLPLDFQQLVNSDENLDSHCNQLPMLSINQKVDSILSPRRRSATGTVCDDLFVPQQTPMLNVAPSNLMGFSHHEYELQSHQVADRVMDHCKPSRGIIRFREDPICLSSDPAGKKLKLDNNSLSDCLMDEPGTCYYFANPNQEPLWKCGEKMFNLPENNDKGQSVGGASQNQKSRTPAGLHERQPLEKFSDASKGKSPCLFEMLTIPSNLQRSYAKDSEKNSGLGVCLYGPNIDNHLFGAKTLLSPEAEKLHMDAPHVSNSLAGIISSSAQKENGCPEEAKEHLAALSIQGSPGYNEESRLHNVNVNPDDSSKSDFCMPGTEIMDLDPLPSPPSRMNSATQSPTPMPTDPSHRWLKRLCHDVADPHVPDSMRLKTGDRRPVGGASTMPGTDIENDHVAARSVHWWLGRWCMGGHGVPVSQEGLHRRMQIKPDIMAGELGGHLPSIKAMAMMGRMMSKVRPLDLERKGPCVMWKTEGA